MAQRHRPPSQNPHLKWKWRRLQASNRSSASPLLYKPEQEYLSIMLTTTPLLLKRHTTRNTRTEVFGAQETWHIEE
jgi:hypothetical protein